MISNITHDCTTSLEHLFMSAYCLPPFEGPRRNKREKKANVTLTLGLGLGLAGMLLR